MRGRTRVIAAAAVAVAVVGTGVGVGVAAGGDDDQALIGETYDRASAAAVREAGGGTVVEAEVGDDGAAYEVEVRRADGTHLEVRLDDRFRVVGSRSDDDGSSDSGPESDSSG
jgi:uncharacterized membrane protein YkoI